MTTIGTHASYPLVSHLLLSSSLLLIHDLGDSCKHWAAAQGSSVMKPQVRLCERGSATPDFQLNVKPAVSEQRPRCHNVTLKKQFREGRAPARAKVSPARKKKKRKQKAEGDTYMTGIFCEPLFFAGGDWLRRWHWFSFSLRGRSGSPALRRR